jgi:hypothetical protein
MAANDSVRHLIDGLIACDEQPSEEQMSELRKTLAAKVGAMMRRVRYSRTVCVVGILLFVVGRFFPMTPNPVNPGQPTFLAATGFILMWLGTILALFGAIGLFLFHGFGYVWARNDMQDAALMELTLQVQRLSQQIDAANKKT